MKHHLHSISLLAAVVCLLSGPGNSFAHEPGGVTADEALRRLELGNARFVAGRLSETTPASIAESIEYAVAHLGSPLIVVLGHERCGAVAAAVSGAKEPGHIATVLNAIQPAVRMTKGQPGDPVENAVRAQALDVAAQLRASGPILKEAVQSGKIKIVAAIYDLHSGKVSLLSAAHE